MKDRSSHTRRRGVLACLLLLLLLVSLIPLLRIGLYARASADDFSYGLFTHRALLNGESLLGASWYTVKNFYLTWQGSFSAMALMTLSPCIFSERAYFLTPIVMLASLILGTVKLTHTIVKRGLGGTWRETLCLSAPMLLLSIQLVPHPLDSFFWWNGAVYYTFTYGIMLLYVERFAALLLTEKPSRPAILLPGALAGILVGGSNYVSALLGACLACCFLLWIWLRHREKRPDALLLLLFLALPFAVSILCPGNSVRQAGLTGMSPVAAITASILKAGQDCLVFPDWPILLTCLALIPLLWRLTGKVSFSFPLPPVFSLFSFLLFAAQNAPHFYAASTSGPPRLRNIVFFSFFWLLFANEWYYLGWLRRRGWLPEALRDKLFRLLPAVCALLICLSMPLYYAPRLTASQCLAQLRDGSAAAYARQQDERTAALLDPSATDLVFEPLHAQPTMLHQFDICGDPNNWVNQAVAWFYGKNSVVLTQ